MNYKSCVSYYTVSLLIWLFSIDITYSQSLTDVQISFLKTNIKTIVRDSLQKLPDWSYLSPYIKNKRIILIGEPNHGSKEIFELRNSLIKYLHKDTGAKVILFESGIGELVNADMNRVNMSPSQMINSLFGPWRTKEFEELMEYVKAENISIAGFDVQRSGESFNLILKEVTRKYKLDSLISYGLESRYGQAMKELTNRAAIYDSLSAKTTELMHDYSKIQEDLPIESKENAPKDLLFTNLTLNNRISYLRYMLQFLKDKDWSARWAARDIGMAANAHWLIENLYKDQPVIIIGHNFHIGKYNENEKVMGEVLGYMHRAKMYTIGFFAGGGSYSDNSGKEVKMSPPDTAGLDVKQVVSSLDGAVNFLHIPATFSIENDWLNKDIIVNETFIDLKNNNKMVLSQTFDGVLFVKKVSAAKVGVR
ncbi:erythromycin esterase family protein [Emticicia agri]|uniref:Erythromycin esterase n=1 Tax=Emticicia agri TaxID=2492393 RepID=A0A4Q5LZ50_9BACT|nr:erythromycin esterase family protein [Emticicia agri]RYU94959.1 hypothetical protein EWM59_14805 [Emticicia agri]